MGLVIMAAKQSRARRIAMRHPIWAIFSGRSQIQESRNWRALRPRLVMQLLMGCGRPARAQRPPEHWRSRQNGRPLNVRLACRIPTADWHGPATTCLVTSMSVCICACVSRGPSDVEMIESQRGYRGVDGLTLRCGILQKHNVHYLACAHIHLSKQAAKMSARSTHSQRIMTLPEPTVCLPPGSVISCTRLPRGFIRNRRAQICSRESARSLLSTFVPLRTERAVRREPLSQGAFGRRNDAKGARVRGLAGSPLLSERGGTR